MPDLLIELQYLPPVATLTAMARADTVWLEACENYGKGSYRNRCLLASANGVQRLSVPLKKGKHQKMPIRLVHIAYDEPWQRIHWQAIQSAYGRAPFFEHYAPQLAFFFKKPWEKLWDLNMALLGFLLEGLELELNIQLTTTYQPVAPAGTLDLRNRIRPGREVPTDIGPLPRYPQVFEERHGFLPNLSALDLLLIAGPEGGWLLRHGGA